MPHYVVTPDNPVVSPVPDFQVLYNCKVRYFPDNQIKITCFSKPIFNPHKCERAGKKEKELELLKEYDPETGTMAYKFVEGKTAWNPFTNTYMPFTILESYDKVDKTKRIRTDSMKRAIDKAFEIGLANNFQYFITLTLDPKKIDRYEPELIYPKLRDWLHNRTRRNSMDYILFPEYHDQHEYEEKPAIHFHGLINAEKLNLTDSGLKTKTGQIIYNLDNWKYGFSTVIKLDGRTAVVRYVTKYITKGNAKIFGKFYFSGGKTLKREVPADFMNVDYATFEGEEYKIPNAGMSVKYKTYNLDFEGELYEGHESDES